jgi:hypothetical protein
MNRKTLRNLVFIQSFVTRLIANFPYTQIDSN